jgi:hypothetical protein
MATDLLVSYSSPIDIALTLETAMNRPAKLCAGSTLLALALCASVASVAGAQATSPPVATTPQETAAVAPLPIHATNLILNGDFEVVALAPYCYFNQSNAVVTSALPGITAYGPASEIDIMNDGTSCGYLGPPQSGTSKIAIHRQSAGGIGDEFSFTLSAPIIAGNIYTVSFYAWSSLVNDPDVGAVDIGISGSATSFGTQVYSGIPTLTGWTPLGGTFTAPVNANYLTVRVALNAEAWIHIDNFILVAGAPTPAFGKSWGSIKSLYRN